jgi:hypothetical protein
VWLFLLFPESFVLWLDFIFVTCLDQIEFYEGCALLQSLLLHNYYFQHQTPITIVQALTEILDEMDFKIQMLRINKLDMRNQ